MTSVRRLSIALAICLAVLTPHASGTSNAQTESRRGRIIRSFTEPFHKSVAASAVTGIISKTNVREGDRVRAGDLLATMNRKVLDASLQIAKARAESSARLDAASSQWELQKSQLSAIEALVEGGHTNRYELEQKQAEYQTAFAEYRSAQDDRQLAKLEVNRIQAELDDRAIRSPIDGFITEIHKQLGENISNTEPQYATIVQIEKLKVRFYLDGETLAQHKAGDEVRVFVGTGKIRKLGKVNYVSPIIDSDSGLGRLEVAIDNSDLKIQSGVVAYWDETNEGSRERRAHTASLPNVRTSPQTSKLFSVEATSKTRSSLREANSNPHHSNVQRSRR